MTFFPKVTQAGRTVMRKTAHDQSRTSSDKRRRGSAALVEHVAAGLLLVSRLWDALGMCWHPLFAMLRRQTFRFAQIFVTRSLLNNKQASWIAHSGATSEKILCSGAVVELGEGRDASEFEPRQYWCCCLASHYQAEAQLTEFNWASAGLLNLAVCGCLRRAIVTVRLIHGAGMGLWGLWLPQQRALLERRRPRKLLQLRELGQAVMPGAQVELSLQLEASHCRHPATSVISNPTIGRCPKGAKATAATLLAMPRA